MHVQHSEAEVLLRRFSTNALRILVKEKLDDIKGHCLLSTEDLVKGKIPITVLTRWSLRIHLDQSLHQLNRIVVLASKVKSQLVPPAVTCIYRDRCSCRKGVK